MSINIKDSTVTVSETGGTAVVYALVQSDGNRHYYQVVADADKRTRRTCMVMITPPKPLSSAPNGYSQQRVAVTFREPMLLANGKITVNSVKFELAADVEASTASITRLVNAVQIFGINNIATITDGSVPG
jgi:hypothetical protein